jgi:hypothetical protein
MKTNQLILYIILILLLSCTSNPEKNNRRDIKYITFENLDISKKWIEIPDRNEPGPGREMSELRTVNLTKIDNTNAIVFNYGYETKWFEVISIEKTKDSILFKTVLPYDTTQFKNISVKFLDKDKFTARWIIDDIICNYFPYKDSVVNNQVSIEDNPQ